MTKTRWGYSPRWLVVRTAPRPRVTKEPIDPSEVLASVQDPAAGGSVLFVGTVRNHARGKEVTGLTYDTYREMAEKKMREVEEQVRKKWPVRRVALVHRYGELRVGEVSVAVAVSSDHRADAFRACRYAIDTIKRSLPLWKKERLKSGGESWVKGTRIRDYP